MSTSFKSRCRTILCREQGTHSFEHDFWGVSHEKDPDMCWIQCDYCGRVVVIKHGRTYLSAENDRWDDDEGYGDYTWMATLKEWKPRTDQIIILKAAKVMDLATRHIVGRHEF